MKKIIRISISVIMIALLCSCGSKVGKQAVEQGKLAMASSDYQTALNSFQLAVNEGIKDTDVQNMLDVLTAYQSAKTAVEKGDYDGAESTLNAITVDYSAYSIKNDIDTMKNDIENHKAEIADIAAKMQSAQTAVDGEDYYTAQSIIADLKTKPLTQEQLNQVNAWNDTVNGKIAELEQAKAEAEKKAKEEEKRKQKSSFQSQLNKIKKDYYNGMDESISTGSQTELVSNIVDRYEKCLEDIYQYLNMTLNSDEFAKVEKEQAQWEKEKDDIIREVLIESEGAHAPMEKYELAENILPQRCNELLKYIK